MVDFEGIDVDTLFPYKNAQGKASYRPYQEKVIIKALTALVEQDYNVFYIDASVGHGKSADIITVERVLSEMGLNSYYTTPQLILQDQLGEFKDLPQVKGRSNYPCLEEYIESMSKESIGEWFFKNPDANCSNAECQINESYRCQFKDKCVYSVQRDKCIDSTMCGMNIAYMMLVRRDLFDQRYLFSCDEAHGVPEWGVGFVSVIIRESDVGFIPVFEKGFQAYILWLEKTIYPRYELKEEQMKERLQSLGKGKRKIVMGLTEDYKRVKNLLKKIDLLLADYEENQEEWIWDIVEDTRGKKLVFQPITSGRFLDAILWSRGEKMLFSSGTITPDIFQEEGGLKEKSFNFKDCVIEVPSEFPPEKSPITYKAIGKMTAKDGVKDISFPLIMKEINQEVSDRKDRKGIIHCFSYDNADYIIKNLREDLKPLMFIQDRTDREGSLERWMKSNEPSVFISTNMTEGLNLKGDLCRYQIYTKVGFPNTTDKRVAKRLELGHWLWYYLQAIEDLEQASGRATRSIDDWSEMFIHDASFGKLFVKYNVYLKKWFKDRMVFVQVI